MIHPRISVIIPVYNVPYDVFEECCKSIIEQTMSSFEVIVVDDESDERYSNAIRDICDNHNFKFVRNGVNRGVSTSRNIGVSIANGEFVAFIDADDCVYPNYFKDAVELMELTGCDCVIGRLLQTSPDLYLPIVSQKHGELRCFVGEQLTYIMIGTLAGRDFMPKIVAREGSFVHAGPCGRLYRRSILEHVHFDTTLSIGEDIIFNLDYLAEAKSCILVDTIWYQYKQYGSSATSLISKRAIEDQINLCDYIIKSKVVEHYSLRQAAYGRIIASLKVLISRGIVRGSDKWQKKREHVLQVLTKPVVEEALRSINIDDFIISTKDKLFLELARAKKCEALLLLFKVNSVYDKVNTYFKRLIRSW